MFAGLTVVIALAGLAVVGIPVLTKTGLTAAGAVVVAVVIALTVVPALLGFWPNAVLPGAARRQGRGGRLLRFGKATGARVTSQAGAGGPCSARLLRLAPADHGHQRGHRRRSGGSGRRLRPDGHARARPLGRRRPAGRPPPRGRLRTLLPPGATGALTDRLLATPTEPGALLAPPERLNDLTPREREVTVLAAEGKSNAEIAGQLVLSVLTVRTHIQRAITKLGARDRAQLVVIAHQTGLVQPAPHAR